MRMLGRHFYRTMFGLAQVFDSKAPDGSPVRILKVGGVFQSATYRGERRFEPVFEYYRAFDAAFQGPASCGEGGSKTRGIAVESAPGEPASDEPAPGESAPGEPAPGHRGGHAPNARDESRTDSFDEAGDVRREGTCRILMVGGGGYAWPKHVLATRPAARLDVVEIDPAIAEIARKHFFVDEAVELFDREEPKRLRTICADGREFLERIARDGGRRRPSNGKAAPASNNGDPAEEKARRDSRSKPPEARDISFGPYDAIANGASFGPYDAIVNDAFSGVEPVRSLATVEAVRLAKSVLVPNGLYLANVVSENEGADLSFLRDTVATLLRAFAHVHIIPCPDADFGGEDNYLLVATDGACSFEGAIPFDEGFLGEPIFDRVD